MALALVAAVVILASCATPMPDTPPAAPPSAQPVPQAPPASQPIPPVPPGPAAATSPPHSVRPDAGASVAEDVPVLIGTVTRVVDGDTIKVQLGSGPITVRLAAVDAPEHDQPWGAQATAALERRLHGRQVELEVQAQDQYDRLVAFVLLGGESLNAWQVQQGNAWAYRHFLSDPRYCVWEADARMYRRGLWGAAPGSQRAPWEWRHAQHEDGTLRYTDYSNETVAKCVKSMRARDEPRPVLSSQANTVPAVLPAPLPAPGACLIKGNISESGKIYHVPGSEWYERTQIDTRKGERWFCTEAEAKAAGWRAPR